MGCENSKQNKKNNSAIKINNSMETSIEQQLQDDNNNKNNNNSLKKNNNGQQIQSNKKVKLYNVVHMSPKGINKIPNPDLDGIRVEQSILQMDIGQLQKMRHFDQSNENYMVYRDSQFIVKQKIECKEKKQTMGNILDEVDIFQSEDYEENKQENQYNFAQIKN